jgi:putative endonuclease
MTFFVYILYSEEFDAFYKGQTQNLEERLNRHNSGLVKSTARYKPWKLVWVTKKTTRKEALSLEKKLKNLSREKLKLFMEKYPWRP